MKAKVPRAKKVVLWPWLGLWQRALLTCSTASAESQRRDDPG